MSDEIILREIGDALRRMRRAHAQSMVLIWIGILFELVIIVFLGMRLAER